MSEIYDVIGKGYTLGRRTEPRIANQLHAYLDGAESILNIGAGAGAYEPDNIDLVAVEPSAEMLRQRAPTAAPAIRAGAERLPFADKRFSHALTILSMHHWRDRAAAFAEITRVTRDRFIALTWNPECQPFWLTRDYFPQIYATDLEIFPRRTEFEQHFDNVNLAVVTIPGDCIDGFLAAYWRRPEAYLKAEIRNNMSSFSKIDDVDSGLGKLRADLDSGTWIKRNHDLLEADSIDAGYCIVSADIRAPG